MKYDGFISYSHSADARLAIAIQTELHRFAKPWYRLRALRLYRDQTNTPAVGSLWDEIEKALRDSRYLILCASPAAAQRPWVADEVNWWIRNRSTENLLVVLAAGRLRWSRVTGDFDWDETDALPRSAVGGFRNEPKHVDVSWAKSPTEIDIRDPRFYEVILDLAATLHGKDKDAMGGDDIRQHRKTQTLARGAIALLAALTIGATVAAYVAVQQRHEALVQRDTAVRQTAIAVSRQLAAQSEALRRSNARLGLLIAAEALKTFKTIEAKAAMFAAVREEPRLFRFVDAADERVLGLASADIGEAVFVPGRPGQLDLVDAITGRNDLRSKQDRTRKSGKWPMTEGDSNWRREMSMEESSCGLYTLRKKSKSSSHWIRPSQRCNSIAIVAALPQVTTKGTLQSWISRPAIKPCFAFQHTAVADEDCV